MIIKSSFACVSLLYSIKLCQSLVKTEQHNSPPYKDHASDHVGLCSMRPEIGCFQLLFHNDGFNDTGLSNHAGSCSN